MAERRKLSQRLQSPPQADPEAVRAFVSQEPVTAQNMESATAAASTPNIAYPIGLIPITVRLSPEIAGALKRVSLERQLARADYFSQQEIVERALKVWLQQHSNTTA